MGDFERTFGEGANAESIINGFNRSYMKDLHYNRFNRRPRLDLSPVKKSFDTFEEASEWSKLNNGKMFKRAPEGNGFIEG